MPFLILTFYSNQRVWKNGPDMPELLAYSGYTMVGSVFYVIGGYHTKYDGPGPTQYVYSEKIHSLDLTNLEVTNIFFRGTKSFHSYSLPFVDWMDHIRHEIAERNGRFVCCGFTKWKHICYWTSLWILRSKRGRLLGHDSRAKRHWPWL